MRHQGRGSPGNPPVPVRWIPLYNLHLVAGDAQWVLVNGYREEDELGGPRHLTLSHQPGAQENGTLLEVLVPDFIARGHVVRGGGAPPGTYRLPASLVNSEGRVRFLRMGPDFPLATPCEGPHDRDAPSGLNLCDALRLSSLYASYIARLHIEPEAIRPPTVPWAFVFTACNSALEAAMASLPELPPMAATPDQVDHDPYRLDDGDDGDDEFEFVDEDAPAREAEAQLAQDHRDLFTIALRVLCQPTPAGLGVLRHALEHVEGDHALDRLRLVVALFAGALAEAAEHEAGCEIPA